MMCAICRYQNVKGRGQHCPCLLFKLASLRLKIKSYADSAGVGF